VCHRARIFKLLMSPGIDSASLCSLADRCDNPIFRAGPTSYIGYIPGLLKSLKIRAQAISFSSCVCVQNAGVQGDSLSRCHITFTLCTWPSHRVDSNLPTTNT
jgi:hypothetical protein